MLFVFTLKELEDLFRSRFVDKYENNDYYILFVEPKEREREVRMTKWAISRYLERKAEEGESQVIIKGFETLEKVTIDPLLIYPKIVNFQTTADDMFKSRLLSELIQIKDLLSVVAQKNKRPIVVEHGGGFDPLMLSLFTLGMMR